MRNTRWIWLGAALALGACGGEETPAGGNGGNGGESGAVSPVKSDCPDCDPAGPNAFVQSGIGTGFYARGDKWQVAFRFDHTPLVEKRDEVFLGRDTAQSEVFLFAYEVTQVDRQVFDNVLRATATVQVTQATPAGADADLFSPERLDRYEHKVVFTLNDLLDPLSEVVYSRDYPHGKRVELDGKSSLRTGGSLYPRTIPRVLKEGGVDAPAPALPADLRDIADAMAPGWADATYKKYTFDNGDVVFWAVGSGQYWPFYVETRGGAGVLVSWN